MLAVEYSSQAERFLRKADKQLARRILTKISSLREEPFSHDTKRVEGYREKLFRVRVGDYRILCEVDQNEKLLGIVKIDDRGKAYQ